MTRSQFLGLRAACMLLLAGAGTAHGQALYTWGDNAYGQLGDGTTVDRANPTPIIGFGFGIDAQGGGHYYSLSVRNGALFAWGENGSGQLGDGTTSLRTAPVAITGLSFGVTAVSTSAFGGQSLAIRNGALFAWGQNNYGQLGDGTGVNKTTPVAIGSGMQSGVTAVSAGGSHSLAVRNGALFAWGLNGSGQLGDGTGVNKTTPVAIGSGMQSGVTAVSAGGSHSLAVRNGALFAWGLNGSGQLGDGTGVNKTTPVAIGSGMQSGVTAVSASEHSLAIKDGVAYAWGLNGFGQLGNGTTANVSTPAVITGLPNTGILQVSAGHYESLALTTDHRLFRWGGDGQSGSASTTPVQVAAPSGFYFASVVSGGHHAVAALMPNAAGVYAAGSNVSGPLGYGNYSTPVAVDNMNAGINAMSAGAAHRLFVRNGAVFASGVNTYGQVGDGTTTQRILPQAIGGGLTSGVTLVSAGGAHSLAIRNGALFAWGRNHRGQLGLGLFTSGSSTPQAVPALASGVTAVSAGEFHTLAIKDGAAYAWGFGGSGQVGNGGTADVASPVLVSDMGAGVTAVAAGAAHSLAIRNGGAVAWGFNGTGALGNSGDDNRTTPVDVTGMGSGVTAIAAGRAHSLAVRDGKLFSWGSNINGQLGDGLAANRNSPYEVAGLPATGILKIAAGDFYSLALTTDKRLFAWGDNSSGQFGNGTTASSNVPVEVFAPAGYYFVDIEAGADHTQFFIVPLSVPEPATVLGVGALALGAAGAWRKRHRPVV